MRSLFRPDPSDDFLEMDDSIADIMESTIDSLPVSICRNFVTRCFEMFFNLIKEFVAWVLRYKFALTSAVFVVMDVLTTVFSKRMIDHTHNYATVTTQGIASIFLVVFFLIYVGCYFFNRPYVQRPFSLGPLITLGVLDIITSTLSAVAATHTSGLMLVLLGQIGVPLTIVTCTVILSKKYHKLHYFASIIIIFFVILKPLTGNTDTSNDILLYNLMYISACVPDAIAAALREMQYTSRHFHLLKYQLFSMLISFAFNVVATMLLVPRSTDMNFFEASFKYFVDGFKCLFLGIDTIVDNCGEGYEKTCDSCAGAPTVLCYYIICNCIIRVAYIIIMLKGSATYIFLLGAVKVPLTSIAFSLQFIAGNSTTQLSLFDVFCFIGTLVGLCIYALGTQRLQESQAQTPSQPLLS